MAGGAHERSQKEFNKKMAENVDKIKQESETKVTIVLEMCKQVVDRLRMYEPQRAKHTLSKITCGPFIWTSRPSQGPSRATEGSRNAGGRSRSSAMVAIRARRCSLLLTRAWVVLRPSSRRRGEL